MKKLAIVIVFVAVIAALVYATATRGGAGAKALGAQIPAEMQPMTVAQALEHAREHPNMEVVLKGKMEEKCPTSGCWFYISDGTDRIRVDTQFSGFNVLDYKSGSDVTVYGKIVKPESGEPEISALGARF